MQEIEGWEKVVNSLASDYDVDLYVTGSNARMMSSESSTYLTGRYVAFRVYTLSFVAQRIASEKTEKLEYERLLEIRDNYPKYVLRTDEFAGGNYEGIKTMHVADFLLSDEY